MSTASTASRPVPFRAEDDPLRARLAEGVRAILAAPHGHRFAHPVTGPVPPATAAPTGDGAPRRSVHRRPAPTRPGPSAASGHRPHPARSAATIRQPEHRADPGRPGNRERDLLDQLRDNPRVAYRRDHGALPGWMAAPAGPRPGPVPRPRATSGNGPDPSTGRSTGDSARSGLHDNSRTGSRTGPRPIPARPPAGPRHRKPRRPRSRTRWWVLAGHPVAAALGALAHHCATLLA
ncbi:hypothetical protein [Nocardiopsis ansamitocini]|uniref:Uncharacterized protein n=1 Tax=Nocardiopsis ansamitocini TaxID=1670832 RepID=A0A9W6PBA7_9ACTN|nr:hypothetical protein [Nocardiopsis ansamitocini]GLU50520.1 hypothetical protein Nans01_48710 [Nocardiopsis ansamitocini]